MAPDIYRISVFVPEALSKGFTFNQFLIDAEEPLLFSTGMRWMFPEVRAAVERILPAHRLHWISSGHASRADEFGALAQWLAVAPEARVVHGQGAVMVQLSDMVDHRPRVLAETEVLDLGTRRVRYTSTPFVQGPWEAGMLFEETTATLLCGDLFAYEGATPATTTGDIVSPAFEHQDSLGGMPLTPHAGSTIRGLADVAPECLALMHGATYTGDCPAALRALADGFDERLHKALDTAA
ncbi:MAG TPA: MBL fold metallo-hydrolase [Acidimicrobiales bacterium]|nr:MBL fold metallo-hydrolase [Acidimicrobiales bacterium]